MTREDLSGRTYGRLTVSSEYIIVNNRVKWLCECKCGSTTYVRPDNLKDGTTSSCGCLRLERLKDKIVSHGATGTKTYSTWEAMNQRCNNAKSSMYNNYGGRGIRVCDRWSGKDGYSNFLEDMGERPKNMSLDRIDVNGNYEPENCRWADPSLQGFNTRKSKNNTSGRSGVSWDKFRSKWHSYIMKDHKKINLGRYDSFEEAVKAREKAEIEHFGFIKE